MTYTLVNFSFVQPAKAYSKFMLFPSKSAANTVKLFGRTTYVLTAYNTFDDIKSYSNGEIGGIRLTYKLSGTYGGLGMGTVYGGPVGLTTGLGFMAGEMFYDVMTPYATEFTKAVARLEYSFKNGWIPGK